MIYFSARQIKNPPQSMFFTFETSVISPAVPLKLRYISPLSEPVLLLHLRSILGGFYLPKLHLLLSSLGSEATNISALPYGLHRPPFLLKVFRVCTLRQSLYAEYIIADDFGFVKGLGEVFVFLTISTIKEKNML